MLGFGGGSCVCCCDFGFGFIGPTHCIHDFLFGTWVWRNILGARFEPCSAACNIHKSLPVVLSLFSTNKISFWGVQCGVWAHPAVHRAYSQLCTEGSLLAITTKINLLQVKGKGASGSFVVVQKSRKTSQKSRNRKVSKSSLCHNLNCIMFFIL